jgi:queuine tRNA-ribosyltransferase
MAKPITFEILRKSKKGLGRAGILHTVHGDIKTPAFVAVGTQATVKALTPDMINNIGLQVVLANTYHLYLRPGEKIIKKAGGLGQFMNWQGPTMTDSGGFQVFSLGKAFENKVNKFSSINVKKENIKNSGVVLEKEKKSLVKISEEGVSFKSPYDGVEHFFTPEKSIKIQNDIGADIIFAFDECPSGEDMKNYQIEAMDRTHRWAKRSLDFHRKNSISEGQAIFGIVQGGKYKDLRKKSAKVIGEMDFDGFGIGGTFSKNDINGIVAEVNKILPEEKPKHLLGIGEPEDLIEAIKSGCDLFDCVAPTRMGRNGTLHTKKGKINISNAKFKDDFCPIEKDCGCYTCKNYTRAYLCHLFRSKEMLAGTLGSIHNLYFINKLVDLERQKIINGK